MAKCLANYNGHVYALAYRVKGLWVKCHEYVVVSD